MKPLSLFFFFLCSCFVLKTQAQENQKKIDSLLEIIDETKIDTIKAEKYLELSDLTMYNDQKGTIRYIEKATALYKKSNNDKGVAKLYAQKANYYYRLGEIDSARHYLVNSVDKSFFIGDTLRGATIRHNIGILDHYQGNTENAKVIMDLNIPIFKKYNDSLHLGNAFLLKGKIGISDGFLNIALQETYNALKMHKEINDDFRIAEDLLQIGIIYQGTGENKKAVDIFNESIAYYKKVDSDQSIAQALNYMADSKIKLKLFESARKDIEDALTLSKKLEYTSNIARTYYNKGVLGYVTGNYPSAVDNLESSLEIWEKIGSPNNQANALFYLGRCYLRKKEASKAIVFFDSSIEIAESIKDPEVLSKVYLEKSVTLEALQNHKEALTYFKRNKAISDSIFTLSREKATLELKTIYETEKKEQEIALLEQKAEINNLQRLLLGVGLGLSFLIFGLGYYALRQKMKRNKLEKEQVDTELAFKKKELTTHALHLAKKNEVLEHIKQKAKELKISENKQSYQQLIQTINFDQQDDKNWENFTQYFEQVHKDFASNAKSKYPDVTKNELRFMALLKMNMSSKEIATILNVSTDGIKKARQRLRKKMDLASEDSLENAVFAI
nr:tetratricopeptide repeat protein [uncultured Allomuricauda sp.]